MKYLRITFLLICTSLHATTVIEESLALINKGIGTKSYTPTDLEKDYYRKSIGENKELEFEIVSKSELVPSMLEGKEGQFVSWYGIVHDVFEISECPGEKILMIEAKYFNNLTDLHLQSVSINGPGDFFVRYTPSEYEIIPLMLVKIYGTVDSYSQAGIAKLKADYIRVWPWGMFNFKDYGEDNTSEIWRQGLDLESLRIYNTWPDREYYHLRLGNSAEAHIKQDLWFDEHRRRLKAIVTKLTDEDAKKRRAEQEEKADFVVPAHFENEAQK